MAKKPRLRLIEPSEPTLAPADEIRDRVNAAIATYLRERTGGTVPAQGSAIGADVLNAVIEIVFRTAIKEGYYRLPGGFGSLKVQTLKSGKKRLPTGEVIRLSAKRSKLRYEEGAAVRELTGMPYKTSYKRKFVRQSKLTRKAAKIAFSQSA